MADQQAAPRNLAEVLGVDGPQVAALMQLGFACFQQGRLKEARDIFEGLVILIPINPYCYTVLGSIHLLENRHEEAVNCFTVSLKLYPKDASTLANRGEALLNLGRFVEAAADLRAAIEMDPEGQDPAANRARLLAAFTLEALKLAEEKGVDAVRDAEKRLHQQLQV